MKSEEAAPLLCAGATVLSAIKSSSAKGGDIVAIQGLGGLGHLALQFAVKLGFKTVVISRGKEKESLAKKLGAHYSRGPDWGSYVKKDGLLITGQNPASSEEVAKLLLKTLKE